MNFVDEKTVKHDEKTVKQRFESFWFLTEENYCKLLKKINFMICYRNRKIACAKIVFRVAINYGDIPQSWI